MGDADAAARAAGQAEVPREKRVHQVVDLRGIAEAMALAGMTW